MELKRKKENEMGNEEKEEEEKLGDGLEEDEVFSIRSRSHLLHTSRELRCLDVGQWPLQLQPTPPLSPPASTPPGPHQHSLYHHNYRGISLTYSGISRDQ
jgi:hypothetical protein